MKCVKFMILQRKGTAKGKVFLFFLEKCLIAIFLSNVDRYFGSVRLISFNLDLSMLRELINLICKGPLAFLP